MRSCARRRGPDSSPVADRRGAARQQACAEPRQQPPTQAQQRPVFRGGTHFVRVDAYPIAGRPDRRGARGGGLRDPRGRQAAEDRSASTSSSSTPSRPRRVRARSAVAARRLRHWRRTRATACSSSSSTCAVQRGEDRHLPYIQQPLVQLPRPRARAAWISSGSSRRATASRISCSRRRATVGRVPDRRPVPLGRTSTGTTRTTLLDALRRTAPAAEGRAIAPTRPTRRSKRSCSSSASIRQERKNVVFVANGLTRARRAGPKLLELNAGQTAEGRASPTAASAIGDRDDAVAANDDVLHVGVPAPRDDRLRHSLPRSCSTTRGSENVSFYVVTPDCRRCTIGSARASRRPHRARATRPTGSRSSIPTT